MFYPVYQYSDLASFVRLLPPGARPFEGYDLQLAWSWSTLSFLPLWSWDLYRAWSAHHLIALSRPWLYLLRSKKPDQKPHLCQHVDRRKCDLAAHSLLFKRSKKARPSPGCEVWKPVQLPTQIPPRWWRQWWFLGHLSQAESSIETVILLRSTSPTLWKGQAWMRKQAYEDS